MTRNPLLTIIYITLGLMVAGAIGFKVFQPVQVLPRIRLGPGFAMTTHQGDMLNNEQLRGSFVLYSFTATRCDTPACDAITQTMQEVQAAIPTIDTGGVPIQLVTVSVDPAHDTPQVLAAYAEDVGAQPEVWTFATHYDAPTLKNIVGAGFEVYYSADEDVDFDTAFVLVDGAGLIRGEYHYQTLSTDTERILRHLGVLAEEVRNGGGPAYEAAHLFLCYAP